MYPLFDTPNDELTPVAHDRFWLRPARIRTSGSATE